MIELTHLTIPIVLAGISLMCVTGCDSSADEQPASDDKKTWINGSGTINNKPALFRADTGLINLPNARDYPYQLIVSVVLQDPDERGYPKEQELKQLHKFEDSLVPAIMADSWGLLAVVLTTDGYRDFIFYVKNHELVPERMKQLEASFSDLQVEVQGEYDANWTQLKRFAGQED